MYQDKFFLKYNRDNIIRDNIIVPQGSVLRATLFLIYIKDLCTAKLTSFANDTALHYNKDVWGSIEREMYEYLSSGGSQKIYTAQSPEKTKLNLYKLQFKK